jgi:hypothetical protein
MVSRAVDAATIGKPRIFAALARPTTLWVSVSGSKSVTPLIRPIQCVEDPLAGAVM